MNSIRFTNFRRFVDFPELKFGKTTLLVGCNNAGKSTLQKALSFIISNIKGMETKWGWNCLPQFIIPENMGTYSRINCKSSKQSMTFEISFGIRSNELSPRFVISFALQEANENATKIGIDSFSIEDRELCYVAEINYGKVDLKWLDYEDQRFEDIIDKSSSILMQTPHFKELDQVIAYWNDKIYKCEELEAPADASQIIDEWSNELSELISLRDERIKKEQDKHLEAYNRETELTTNLLSSDLDMYVHPTPYLITDALENLSKRCTIHSDYNGDKPSKSIQARIHESCADLIHLMKGMSLAILPAHSLEKTVFYQSSHPLYPLFNTILEESAEPILVKKGEPVRTEIEKKILSFIKIFNLAENFRIRSIEGIAITCELKDKDGNWIHLCEMGSGTLRLMELFLFIACSKSYLLFIEEPEQNLHPKYQSLLADLFSLVDKQIVVETHSEYLVRRTQVLISQMNLSEDDMDAKNPFKVYYFPEEAIPYDMSYLPSGQFEEAFGEGFFDEAGKWTRELILNRRK